MKSFITLSLSSVMLGASLFALITLSSTEELPTQRVKEDPYKQRLELHRANVYKVYRRY